jgi:hypothetical protein
MAVVLLTHAKRLTLFVVLSIYELFANGRALPDPLTKLPMLHQFAVQVYRSMYGVLPATACSMTGLFKKTTHTPC